MVKTQYPKVSVIMALYNKERFVAEAIRSALNQSYENLELLIVDDKSTDGSLEVASQFEKEERVRIIHNSENSGIAYSRNQGIKEAKGEVIAFLDADDVYHPDKLAIQLREMSADGNYRDVVVYSDYFSMDENSQLSRLDHLDAGRIHTGNLLSPILRTGGLRATASIILLRQSAFDVGLFDEGFRIREDFDFILKLASTRTFIGIPEPLYGYRIHTNSMIYNSPKAFSYLMKLKIMQKHLRLHPDLLKGKDGSEIRTQLARCMIISRSYKTAFASSVKDPRMIEAFYFCLRNR